MEKFPKTLMLLGSGELGKEVVIAAKRVGCKVIACDKYKDAPAMQIADIAEVFDMSDPKTLKEIICSYKPDAVVPEIEALAVEALHLVEDQNITVIPNARATQITMNRDKIRDLASKGLGLKTAKYAYASNLNELIDVSRELNFPVFVKPVMSSSGKGQSLVNNICDLEEAWNVAIKGARGASQQVIVEEKINFDLEITLLTIRQKNGPTLFCPPIGHEQVNGDYQLSWQPAQINPQQLDEAQRMAKLVTDNLGGVGLFGVEFFINKEEVIFSELSPRPHDTGLVTLISQNLSEFELHIRAILSLPIPKIEVEYPSASKVILARNESSKFNYIGIDKALNIDGTKVLIFGKPTCKPGRRMGVSIAKGNDVMEAIEKANKCSSMIEIVEG